jgi:betaine-aldehyde dehydrogenase
VLIELARMIRARASELAELEATNSGKPIAEAEDDMEDAATCFEYYGGLATKLHGDVLQAPDESMMLALREPVGVAAQIIPWNFPLLMAAWKIAPALCAGCTVVLKPAEQTPVSILELAHSFRPAGLPPGVVNIVTGGGDPAGAALVNHPAIDKIAFTGSPEVGRSVMRAAAGSLKKVSLELGGKSPSIFFSDADFEPAVRAALFGVFLNQGEVCSAGSRILVERSTYKRFLDAMVEKAKGVRLGPPLDRATTMGPLISAEHLSRVREFQEIGKKEARLAAGGGRPTASNLARGFFVEPTIFYDVPNDARIAREEIFGPVACVIPFDTDEDAIRLANDTTYGLAAAVWTRDIFRALRTVKALKAGIVWVNDTQTSHVEGPWGGYKQSGIGRELGPWGVDAYLETKQVFINLDETKFRPT